MPESTISNLGSAANQDPLNDALPGVPEGIRRSQLLLVLHEKIGGLPPGAFPFLAEFKRLRDLVAPQISATQLLFNEFTPHDEHLHVTQLFQLADKLFGAPSYRGMEVCELFLLAAALYAHDWGMAVGHEEQEFLRHGAPPRLLKDNFTPLRDEVDQLKVFARRQGLSFPVDGTFPVLSQEHLRTYVRDTHARRSASRVRKHFHQQQGRWSGKC